VDLSIGETRLDDIFRVLPGLSQMQGFEEDIVGEFARFLGPCHHPARTGIVGEHRAHRFAAETIQHI